jgi:hypothetical protein
MTGTAAAGSIGIWTTTFLGKTAVTLTSRATIESVWKRRYGLVAKGP